jgi:hypothetical protein
VTYYVNIKTKGGTKAVHESLIDGIVPQRVIDLMLDSVVDEELQLCRICDVQGRRCHVLLWVEHHTYAKF